MSDTSQKLTDALWRIYQRPEQPQPWELGGNLPWNEPDFSRRMLREHLDESHGAASRTSAERALQIDWLWQALGLRAGAHVLDVTCGPGLYAVALAQRGCTVTAVDFAPAAIEYARELAAAAGVADRCRFILADVREVGLNRFQADAALFLYGQLAVFPTAVAAQLLTEIGRALLPGGRLAVELLDEARVDKKDSTWWYTDNKRLWGNAPFLHLGERKWLAAEGMSVERFYIIHLETGRLDEIILCDQTYTAAAMTAILKGAGFGSVDVHPNWAGLPLYDAAEWQIYIAQKLA